MVARPAWGTKRRCPSCGAPFYDLNRHPAICPKCHAEYVSTSRAPARLFRAPGRAALPVVEDLGFEEDEVLERDDEHEQGEDTLIPGEADEEGDELRD